MRIPIRCVIFDYGNVLCHPQRRSDLEQMAKILNVPDTEFEPAYWRHRMIYDASEIDAEGYWEQVGADLQRTPSESDINALRVLDVQSWSWPHGIMIAFAESARLAGMHTAVLSNMPRDLRLSVAEWLPQFHNSTYSCDVRTCKPGAEIYRHCLAGLDVPASECLFLDDREENVAGAQKAGIHSFVFTTAEAAAEIVAHNYHLPVPIDCH